MKKRTADSPTGDAFSPALGEAALGAPIQPSGFIGSAQAVQLLKLGSGPQHASPHPSIIPSWPLPPGPANWTDRIIIFNQDYTLAGGQYLYANQTSQVIWPLIAGDGYYSHKLVNDGTLWIEGALPPNVNSAHVAFTVSLNTDVVNHGVAVAYARVADNLPFADAYTIRAFNTLANTGQIFAVTQAGFAYAARSDSIPAITNSGLIAARADVGAATAVRLDNGGTLVNQAGGQILAEAVFAEAVHFGRGARADGGSGPQIINAGLIQAASLDPNTPSVALSLSNLAIDRETIKVDNSGTIKADIAIADDSEGAFTPVQASIQDITNEAGGLIEGAIFLERGNDVITNSGTIHGIVSLGEGDDSFDTANGVLQGAADLGWGRDTFKGSAGADFVAGDDGNDIIEGNGGNDQLMGGANDDVLIGGAGNDGLFGEYGNDRIVTAGGDFVSGGAGDDRIELGDYTFEHVSGGDGFDTLVLPAGTRVIDLAAMLATQALDGIENILLGGGKELIVRVTDIPLLTAGGTTLRVDGSAGDAVDLVGSWTSAGSVVQGGVTYRQYQSAGETVLVSGQATVAIRDAAPVGAVGLDPVAPGDLAPIPGDGPLDFTSNELYLLGYELSQSLTVNPEQTWWNDGGIAVLTAGLGLYTLTNLGTLLSETSEGGLGTILQTLDLHNLQEFVNRGTTVASWTADDGRDHSGEEDRYGLIYATVSGNRISNYGVIEAGTVDGVAIAAIDPGVFYNYGTVYAQSIHGYATAIDRAGLLFNYGNITSVGYSAVGIHSATASGQNDGVVTALRTAGGVDSVGILADQNFEGTYTNNGTITADVAFRLAGGFYSGLAPIHVINQGTMNGRIETGSVADSVINKDVIHGDVHLNDGNDVYDGHAGMLNGVADGGAGNDSLIGGAGMDVLAGGNDADTLTGGTGQDRLSGGDGGDVFVFADVRDSASEAHRSDGGKLLPDVITDFTSGQDKIDLSQIDAVSGTQGNDAFTFVGSAAFSHHAGELRFDAVNGYVHIYADVNGDGSADMEIVAHTPTILASDFVL